MNFLKKILQDVSTSTCLPTIDIEISSVEFDSRKCQPGCLFVATVGTLSDGHSYIKQSVESGAVAIVCEKLPNESFEGVVFIVTDDSTLALARIAANFYENPSEELKLIGVTGTNGKTTIATLLFDLYTKLGFSVGLLSTVENRINGEIIPSTHTTPDVLSLNKLLREMIDKGCQYCFMEVSSHAIDQKRIDYLDFDIAAFTNISHDHLDYHKTFAEYIKAKKRFFDNLSSEAIALTNLDDRNGMVMLQNTQAAKQTYSLKSLSDFKSSLLESHFDGTLIEIDNQEIWIRLIGGFNIYNILTVYSIGVLLEQDKTDLLKTISELTPVNGRFDLITSDSGVRAIVDYAHTPDALQNVLDTINDIVDLESKVITVVGAGGDRDKTKRPKMASIAENNSTMVFLTSDNPRFEKPESIIEDMKQGVSDDKKVICITDRREAIKTACQFANKGDVILIAGKGHEDYQDVEGVKHHFDDKEIVRELLML